MSPLHQNAHQPHDQLSNQTVHDLRAPLTVIRGQAQMLARWVNRHDAPESDAARTRLATIDATIVALCEQIDALRDGDPD